MPGGISSRGLSTAQVQTLIDATPGVRKQITATAHGFMVGDVLRMDGTAYTKAKADSAANAEVVGMVASVPDANTFVLAIGGLVPVSALNFEEESVTPGALYFLSVENAGLMQLAEPSTDGQISKPVFIAVSATAGYFFNMRGEEVGAGTADYLVYTALLTQSGSDAPVATVLQNTLGEELTFGFSDNGFYTIDSALNSFDPTKTWFSIAPKMNDSLELCGIEYASMSVIFVRTRRVSDNVGRNNVLNNTPVEIRIYP